AAGAAARGGELSGLEPADGGADTAIEAEFPPVQRRRGLGASVDGNHQDRRKNHQERPPVRHAGLLEARRGGARARTGTEARPDASPSGEDQQCVRESAGGARGRLVFRRGDGTKSGPDASMLAIRTRNGSASTPVSPKVADVLAM